MNLSFPICRQMGRKGMPHGMVTWETCGRNLRLRPKYPFLWVLVPAMHSQVRSTFHTLAHSSSQPLSGVDHITTLIVQLEKLRLSERKCVCVCVPAWSAVLTLCHPTDCGPPGSSVRGISQAEILEWDATPSSRGSS